MKRTFASWPFGRKIAFIVLATTSLTLLLACGSLLVNDFFIFRGQQERRLTVLANVIGINTQAALAFGDSKSAETTLSALKAEKHLAYAAIFARDGGLFASYAVAPGVTGPRALPEALALATGGERHNRTVQPVMLDGKAIGTIYLESDRKEFRDLVGYYLVAVFLIFVGAVCAAYPLSQRFQKTVTSPIYRLTSVAKKVSEERDYSLRAEKENDDELGLLTENFNGMLGEIQARENTLNSQWKWLQNVLDLMPTPFLLADLETGEVTSTNRAAAALAGGKFPFRNANQTPREGQTFSVYDAEGRYVRPEDLPISRLARGEKLEGVVINWLTPSGLRTLVVYGDALPSLYGHSSVGVITFHDITDLKKTEQELKNIAQRLSDSNSELAQTNKDLEQFAYIASHDLQEPLRKIIAFSERLQNGQNLSQEERNDFLTRVYNAGHRMRRVIEDLLQFSRVSRDDVLFERVSLATTMQEVLSDLEIMITEAHAKIEVGAMPEVTANKAQMRHLFQNLITNSIKFSKKGTPPRIAVESVPSASGMTEVRVSDNGIGFDEKYSDKIFKPFQRLHGKDEYEGTGIGLSIVDKIVRNHHGRIRVKSAPGEGSTFIVSLPSQ